MRSSCLDSYFKEIIFSIQIATLKLPSFATWADPLWIVCGP